MYWLGLSDINRTVTESEFSKSMLKAYSSIHLATHYEKYYITHVLSPVTLQPSVGVGTEIRY